MDLAVKLNELFLKTLKQLEKNKSVEERNSVHLMPCANDEVILLISIIYDAGEV